jgi:hypothetical protein
MDLIKGDKEKSQKGLIIRDEGRTNLWNISMLGFLKYLIRS